MTQPGPRKRADYWAYYWSRCDIDAKTDGDLLAQPNFGRRSLWEVRETIENLKKEASHDGQVSAEDP